MPNNDLQRFIDAQSTKYETALAEIKNGKKESHWMWYIFPQLEGLGISDTAKFYGIKDLNEAAAFLGHEVLGPRLIGISNALLQLTSNDAYKILGSPDDLKLHSSITLFSMIPNTDKVFDLVLQKFFDGKKDLKTIALLQK